ncbi:MAG: hypothetical protein IJW31_09860 [Lentisphaeria bacterium]|nr:hypothetical protein [Lentisphaeria bacterium]
MSEADAISIFNVIVYFRDQGKYNARMVIKHFGEAKNFYDHKLTKFEELSDLELQPEGSGSLNNSSTSTNIPQSDKKSSNNLEFSNKRLHNQINPAVRDGVVRQEKSLYINKEKVQSLITQQQTNFADVSNLDLNSINNIIQNFKNSSTDLDFSRKRLHNQINPAVRDGVVRQEKSSTSRHRLVMAQYKNFSLLTGQ